MQAGAEEAVEAEEADRGEREGELVEVAWQPARVATRRAADSPSVDSSYGEAESRHCPCCEREGPGASCAPGPKAGGSFSICAVKRLLAVLAGRLGQDLVDPVAVDG